MGLEPVAITALDQVMRLQPSWLTRTTGRLNAGCPRSRSKLRPRGDDSVTKTAKCVAAADSPRSGRSSLLTPGWEKVSSAGVAAY